MSSTSCRSGKLHRWKDHLWWWSARSSLLLRNAQFDWINIFLICKSYWMKFREMMVDQWLITEKTNRNRSWLVWANSKLLLCFVIDAACNQPNVCVAGVAWFGDKTTSCQSSTKQNLYTRVSNYVNWIHNETGIPITFRCKYVNKIISQKLNLISM